MRWRRLTAGDVVLSSTRSTKPVGVSGASTMLPVIGSTAYRMMRTRSVGAAGVKAPSCSYIWVVVFHTHVVPSSAGGTTLALMPPENVAAPRRSASRRAAAFASSALDLRGGVIGAARSSVPTRLGAAVGEPVARLTASKLCNIGDRSTPDTVSRLLLRRAGSDRCACGPVLSLQAATTRTAATARPHQERRYTGM